MRAGKRDWRGPILVLLSLLALALTGITRGPIVVRQVWNLIGVRRVEAHAEVIRAAAQESRLDPCLLAGVMYAESRGRIDAQSEKGAMGLFQLMPAAARDAARRLGIQKPTDAQLLADELLNARLASNHLTWLLRNEGPDLERVLVAYNAGRTKARRWYQDEGGFDTWRARHVAAEDNTALVYAGEVLAFAERFRERGVIDPSVRSGQQGPTGEPATLRAESAPAAAPSSGPRAPSAISEPMSRDPHEASPRN